MYNFPLQHLTLNDGYNNSYADQLESEFMLWYQQKEYFYNQLPRHINKGLLYQILEQSELIKRMLVNWLRTRHDVFQSTLVEKQRYQTLTNTRDLLRNWRILAREIYAGFDDYFLMDHLLNDQLWDNGINNFSDPQIWNNIVYHRLQDIHRHLFYILLHSEGYILTNLRHDIINEIPKMVIIVREMNKHLNNYCHFVNSLFPSVTSK